MTMSSHFFLLLIPENLLNLEKEKKLSVVRQFHRLQIPLKHSSKTL
jgi:hypothetical protein